MHRSYTYLPYSDTGYFSALVTDYLGGSSKPREFFTYTPDAKGIEAAIQGRSKFPIDRKALVETLRRQYEGIEPSPALQKNIELLAKDNTFTVCTAHQPNLLTGYLYFVYKIIHAIKLAEELKVTYPGKDFVPVYYMGSEDNDLDELGTFNYSGKKYRWDAAGQTGAVGRMSTQSLESLLKELFKLLGPPGESCDELKDIISKAYLQHDTVAQATRFLVNALFGRYGLVVIDADEAVFKKAVLHIIKDELLQQQSYSIVSAQVEKLEAHYKAQAQPRPINLFYLEDGIRERIEKKQDKWVVVNTNIEWTESGLLQEVEAHPERFSPNVILRGLLQESILPDVAFIGGGAEVAYWLQLKPLFEHYKVFYPAVLLRQSVLWLNERQSKMRAQAGLGVTDIFQPEAALIKQYVTKHGSNGWQTAEETKALENIMEQLKQKATSLDVTLRSSSEAVLAKMKHQLLVLEKKMLRAEKRRMQTELERIARLKADIFPNNGLQERVENFSGYFLQYGHSFFDILKDAIQPLKNEFLVVEETTA